MTRQTFLILSEKLPLVPEVALRRLELYRRLRLLLRLLLLRRVRRGRLTVAGGAFGAVGCCCS